MYLSIYVADLEQYGFSGYLSISWSVIMVMSVCSVWLYNEMVNIDLLIEK